MSTTESQSVIGALEQFAEPGSPSLALYEYLTGDRVLRHLDIDEYLEGMRRARTLVARFEHRTRTEWVFPAMAVDEDAVSDLAGCTDPWVLVFEATEEDTWHHQNRIHESSVISRGIPEPEQIVHVNDVETVVPAVALANKAPTHGGVE